MKMPPPHMAMKKVFNDVVHPLLKKSPLSLAFTCNVKEEEGEKTIRPFFANTRWMWPISFFVEDIPGIKETGREREEKRIMFHRATFFFLPSLSLSGKKKS